MKITIRYNPKGESGNIFAILGQLRDAMRKQRRIDAFNQIWERMQKCESYEDALKIIGEEAELIEERDEE